MTYRELTAHYTDGTAKVVRREREDAKGREQIDKVAFALMASPKVRYCTTKLTDYTIQSGGSVR